MTESTHTLTALVVHRLIRAAEGPSQLELRSAPNPLDDASARLMERLCRYFAERPGKGFGHFERDERSFPMPAMVRRHVIEERIDFTAFSAEMLAREFPGHGNAAVLMQAARRLGFRVKPIAVQAGKLAGLPLPLVVTLHPDVPGG